MDKKTKLMAICAAGAAVILIGAGLARCAATPAEPEAAAPAAEEASAPLVQEGEALSGYMGTTWESADGSATLTLSLSLIHISEPTRPY